MSYYQCPWVRLVQALQQCMEGSPLCWCPRVAGLAASVQPAFVAHANGVAVVPLAVRPNGCLAASRLYLSVAPYHIVVA